MIRKGSLIIGVLIKIHDALTPDEHRQFVEWLMERDRNGQTPDMFAWPYLPDCVVDRLLLTDNQWAYLSEEVYRATHDN